MPGVKQLWTYAETGFHPLAAAIVRESYKREALGSAFRILGEGQLTLTKFLIVTDQNIDLADFPLLLEAVLERFDPKQDLFIFNNTSFDTLDYTGDRLNHGSKAVLMGIGEPKRSLPRDYYTSHNDSLHVSLNASNTNASARPNVLSSNLNSNLLGITNVAVYCAGCLVVSGAAYTENPKLAQQLLDQSADRLAAWPLVILVDNVNIARDQTSFLWTVFTRFNPAADLYAQARLNRHHLGYECPIIIDARMKPGYPDELFPREDIVQRVDQRWSEYFGR
jgi:3-polyprenyl-4-hydroxybenzoate decarboxylase